MLMYIYRMLQHNWATCLSVQHKLVTHLFVIIFVHNRSVCLCVCALKHIVCVIILVRLGRASMVIVFFYLAVVHLLFLVLSSKIKVLLQT